jgi:RNA polymerase sigma-70 factor (ECF subfamily)
MVAVVELSALLERMTDAAASSWPAFVIDRAAFQARLLAGSGIDPRSATAAAARALYRLHASDLYLACACTLGSAPALAEFSAHYLSRVEHYLSRFRGTVIRAEDVRRELEDRLLFGRGGGRGRIGQYTGRGALERFVATAARNTARSLLRARGHEDAGAWEGAASRLTSPPYSTRNVFASRYGTAIAEALLGALATLDARQRTVLRLHLVQSMTLTRIAQTLCVHQSTISRRFHGAIRAVHAHVRRRLRDEHGVSDADLGSIIDELSEQLDLSLAQALRDEGVDR